MSVQSKHSLDVGGFVQVGLLVVFDFRLPDCS